MALTHRFLKRDLPSALSRISADDIKHDVRILHASASEQIAVPPLVCGAQFASEIAIRQEPTGTDWREAAYASFSPSVVSLENVVVRGEAGIMTYGGQLISDTLENTSPELDFYHDDGSAVETASALTTTLHGRFLCLLAGGAASYFHDLIDVIARVSSISDDMLRSVDGILVPQRARGSSFILEMLLEGRPQPPVLHKVGPGEVIGLADVVLPSSIRGQAAYHPQLRGFFSGIAARVAGPGGRPLPRRIYIDRRASSARRLLNETDLIDALTPLGIMPVRLEDMDVADQIRLFRGASLIVAPHGAGLANLVFAQPDALVMELLMDSYVNWSFRRLAALCALRYDCVIGRAVGRWTDLSPAIHGMSWVVSPFHVAAAVQRSAAG